MKRRLPGLNSLKAFEAAGASGSFTRAAELLNVTQSAVSRQVRQLEEQLGRPLLLRHHQRLELTDDGLMLLAELQQVFDRIEAVVRRIDTSPAQGRLRLNAPFTFARRWLMPRLSALRRALPDVDISLTTCNQDTLEQSQHLDCAIRFGDGEWQGLHSQLLLRERHVAVCSPGLLEKHDHQLHTLPMLHVLASSNRRFNTWRHWLDAAGLGHVPHDRGIEFDMLDLAIDAAIRGAGITVADLHMVEDELACGRLVQHTTTCIDGHESYWLVTRPGTPWSRRLQVFAQWLQQQTGQEGLHDIAAYRTARLGGALFDPGDDAQSARIDAAALHDFSE